MNTACIYNIDITTNSKDIISVSSDFFDHFYIANIDNNGDEIGYTIDENNYLNANFFMLRILNDKSKECRDVIERLFNQKDIISIALSFTNGIKQVFNISKKRVVNNGIMENIFEDAFMYEDNLCIIVSDKKIKYKKELFI